MRKRNCLGWITSLVLLFTVQPSYSCCYFEGKELVQNCRSHLRGQETGGRVSDKEVLEATICMGYVLGLTDTIDLFAPRMPHACLPKGTGAEAITTIVAQYLVAHPEQWSLPAIMSVRTALAEKFPCK